MALPWSHLRGDSEKGIKRQQAGYKKLRSQEEGKGGSNSREHGEAPTSYFCVAQTEILTIVSESQGRPTLFRFNWKLTKAYTSEVSLNNLVLMFGI